MKCCIARVLYLAQVGAGLVFHDVGGPTLLSQKSGHEGDVSRRGLLAGVASVGLTTPTAQAASDVFELEVPLRGKDVGLSKFRGGAHLVVNVKMDDPQAGLNFASLRSATTKYAASGLRIWAFPTEQGYFEPDVAELIRYKAYQQFGFGQYPASVLFDKIDVVGNTAHPLYRTLCSTPNPNGLNRISLNYEKFLLDDNAKVLRRYPRKFTAYDFDDDIQAALAKEPLPPPSSDFLQAWKDAQRDAIRGEYSFRSNYNVYDQSDKSTDWTGLAELGFQ